ncbi:hypothetical protein Ais01nite_35330 [Asanoa ishikariensis]|nr:hypothetical protein Ais01nite_35330 [Asanoa ishikariensis]
MLQLATQSFVERTHRFQVACDPNPHQRESPTPEPPPTRKGQLRHLGPRTTARPPPSHTHLGRGRNSSGRLRVAEHTILGPNRTPRSAIAWRTILGPDRRSRSAIAWRTILGLDRRSRSAIAWRTILGPDRRPRSAVGFGALAGPGRAAGHGLRTCVIAVDRLADRFLDVGEAFVRDLAQESQRQVIGLGSGESGVHARGRSAADVQR